MGGALEGLRLIDLTEGIAGPYATALFAGLGADVLKIERAAGGDVARRWDPFPGDDPDPETGGHLGVAWPCQAARDASSGPLPAWGSTASKSCERSPALGTRTSRLCDAWE